MAVPYTFATQTGTIPLSYLDSNFTYLFNYFGNYAPLTGATFTGGVTAASLTSNGSFTVKGGKLTVYDTSQTLPAGVSTEVTSSLINFGINEGSGNRFGTYNSANQGGMFVVDGRAGTDLFRWYGRAAGVTTNAGTELMHLTSAGQLSFLVAGQGIRLPNETSLYLYNAAGSSATGVLKKGNDNNVYLSNYDGNIFMFGGSGGTLNGTAVRVLPGGLLAVDGGQIYFPSAQNASADPHVLDDYEEGDLTPIYSAQTGSLTTVTTNSCKYTKIGNVLIVNHRFTVTNNGTGATALGINYGNSFIPVDYATGACINSTANTNGAGQVFNNGGVLFASLRRYDGAYPVNASGDGFQFSFAVIVG